MKLIIDCETGETQEIELTQKDIKQQEVDEKAWNELEVQRAALEVKKQEVLNKLGLTADEVAALLA